MEEEKGFKFSIAVPGEKLVEKMWDSLATNGVAVLLKPWSILREGKARAEVRRYEALAIAQAKCDALDIKSGKKRFSDDGKLVQLPSSDQPRLTSPLITNERIEPRFEIEMVMQAATNARAADLVRSEVNVAETVLMAEDILAENPKPVPEESIDDDWLSTWRDYVSKVSSEKLQYLWASALAGEVVAPGTFSIRTLDFLRTLSRGEAEEISELAQYYVQGMIMKNVEPILTDGGVSFGQLLRMQELGMISGVGGLGLRTTFSSITTENFTYVLLAHDKVLVVSKDEKTELTLQVFQFTALGRQIMELGDFKANTNHLRNVGKMISLQGFDVVMADLVHSSNTEVTWRNEEKIIHTH